MSAELLQVVDEYDNPVGEAYKEKLHEDGLRHRVVRIMVEDESGNILLQRRKDDDGRIWEGCWDNSVAGHVRAGESYIDAALREAREELGLQDIKLEEISHYKTDGEYKDRILNRWNRLYRLFVSHNVALSLEAEKIAETKWVTARELSNMMERMPEYISDGLLEAYEIMYKT